VDLPPQIVKSLVELLLAIHELVHIVNHSFLPPTVQLGSESQVPTSLLTHHLA